MSVDLYTEFGVQKSATTQEIKAAYRKLALLYHPDKQKDKTPEELKESTHRFQSLTGYYETLIDPEKRNIYDRTGQLGVEISLESDCDWSALFEYLYQRVTSDSIEKYEKQYKYSNLERQDVLKAYHDCKGDVLKMIDKIPLSTLDDIDRFIVICKDAIQQGEVQQFKLFPTISKSKLIKKKKQAEKEKEECRKEMELKQNELDQSNELQVQLQNRNKERLEGLISSLEKKAGGKKGAKKRKEGPTEEEFLEIQQKLFKK
jgi:DnaJ homolog subfamily C member 9